MITQFKSLMLTGASAILIAFAGATAALADPVGSSTAEIPESTVSGNTSIDLGSQRMDTISGSFNSPTAGVFDIQANNGNANAINVATAITANMLGGVAVTTTATVTSNTNNNMTVHVGVGPDGVADRENRILNSFVGFAGTATVQQNNGDSNEIGAATAIYGSSVPVLSVTQRADANSTTNNQCGLDCRTDALTDVNSRRENLIDPSFNGATGTITVQQNNGNANAMSVATAVMGAPGITPGGLTQTADADATVFDLSVVDTGDGRSNRIMNSFNRGAAGNITVQQNNGDANAMSVATAIAGIDGFVRGSVSQTTLANDNDIRVSIRTRDDGNTRTNLIDPSFTGVAGTITVQQNNGNANAISAATAVAGISSGVGGSITQNKSEAEGNDLTGFVRAVERGPTTRDNTITNSFVDADGIITVQQNNGDANTMNASTAVVAVARGVGGNVTQQNADSEFNDVAGDVETVAHIRSTRTNTIDPSFTRVAGVVTVQQNNGNANTMNAATQVVAVAGAGAGVLGNVSQNDLEADENTVRGITTTDPGQRRSNTIDESFNLASGLITVQQNNGDANTINAATAVTAVVDGVGGNIGQPSGGEDIEADQNVVEDITVADGGSTRSNTIDPSFRGASGTITVQQNNGDANTMNVATAVVGVGGSAGSITQVVEAGGLAATLNSVVPPVTTTDSGSDRDNDITDGSFNLTTGMVTVQQNNGSANTINAANAVTGVVGNVTDITQTVLAVGGVGLGGSGQVSTNDQSSTRDNLIMFAFDGASGVMTVQQNNGDANSMNAATAVAAVGGADDVTQSLVKADGEVVNVSVTDDGSSRTNTIDEAFDTQVDGIVTVQQNNGDANVLSAATAVVAVLGRGKTSDDTSQTVSASGRVTDATFTDDDKSGRFVGPRRNIIDPSFDETSGIVTVQQNNGGGNVLASATGVRLDRANRGDGDGPKEDVLTQPVSTSGTVLDNVGDIDGTDGAIERRNTIASDSFLNFSGVATVQQNNGDNNVIAAATGVVANDGAGDDIDTVTGAAATTTGTVERNEQDITASPDQEFANVENILRDSFKSSEGVVTVQQNNGNNNVMGSAISVVANLLVTDPDGAAGAVANTATGTATVRDNDAIIGTGSTRLNTIDTGAFNGASVVANIQQNNGENNVIGQATSVLANNNTGGPGNWGPSITLAALTGTVSGNTVTVAAGVVLTNTISASFIGTTGVVSITQNNGSNSIMGSSIAVVANF